MRSKVILILAVAVAVLLPTSAWASASWKPHTYQNAATAIPAATGASASDLSSKVYKVAAGAVRGSAVATASITCDGCSADAVTMQVLYARTVRTISVNNVAAAWAACTGCQGSALSLQIVLARSAGQVVANNRSLALNASCQGCHTAAAAVQIVLISPGQSRLSDAMIGSLIAFRQQLHDELVASLAMTSAPAPVPSRPVTAGPGTKARSTTSPSAQSPISRSPVGQSRGAGPSASPLDQTVLELQQLLAADVHASSARHSVQLHQG